MNKKRIGINGFGRMGRLALRVGWDFEEAFAKAKDSLMGGKAKECLRKLTS